MKTKGKALFIIHDVYQDDNNFPLGPAYLASTLKKDGHDVEIYSQDVFHNSNEELAEHLDSNTYDMIGLGFLAGRYVETVRPLSEVIRRHKKNAKFVLGGSGVSPIPEYILADTLADIAVIGEGERIISPLLTDIADNTLRHKKRIAWRDGTNIHVGEREPPVRRLDSLEFPAWDLFSMEEYISGISPPGSSNSDRAMSLISSRGCIGECSFCYRMEKGIRLRSIRNVREEIEQLQDKYGITYLQFHDEMLIPNEERLKEFTDMINNLATPISYGGQSRVELAKNPRMLKMLKDSGCKILNMGQESLSQEVLDLMGKRVKVADNYEAAEKTIEAGIDPGLNFIWANPGDTLGSLDNIVQFLIDYDTLAQLRTIRPPTPFPGSPLYYQAIAEGKLQGPADFFEKFTNSDRLTVNFTGLPDNEVYSALLEANTRLINNHFSKKQPSNEVDAKANARKEVANFKKLYFPASPEDLKFRGSRHYNKKSK